MEKSSHYIEGHIKTIMNHEKVQPNDLTDDERKTHREQKFCRSFIFRNQ